MGDRVDEPLNEMDREFVGPRELDCDGESDGDGDKVAVRDVDWVYGGEPDGDAEGVGEGEGLGRENENDIEVQVADDERDAVADNLGENERVIDGEIEGDGVNVAVIVEVWE
jgi:hypothetical protein